MIICWSLICSYYLSVDISKQPLGSDPMRSFIPCHGLMLAPGWWCFIVSFNGFLWIFVDVSGTLDLVPTVILWSSVFMWTVTADGVLWRWVATVAWKVPSSCLARLSLWPFFALKVWGYADEVGQTEPNISFGETIWENIGKSWKIWEDVPCRHCTFNME